MTTTTEEALAPPMLAKVAHMIPTPASDWTMEPKLDGWRFMIAIDETGDAQAFTRRQLRLGRPSSYRMPGIEHDAPLRFPPDTILDCEVIVRGNAKQSTDVATALADGKRRRGEIQAVVFDIVRHAGDDVRALPWTERRELLESALADTGSGPIRLMPSVTPRQQLLDTWLEMGLEGAVLKRRDSRYENKRSRKWLKLKPQATFDAPIVGFTPGGGKFDGLIGAVQFDHNGRIGKASGMSNKVREDMTRHPDRYVAQLAEFAHHGFTRKGAPRSPQFKRMRPDK